MKDVLVSIGEIKEKVTAKVTKEVFENNIILVCPDCQNTVCKLQKDGSYNLPRFVKCRDCGTVLKHDRLKIADWFKDKRLKTVTN